jgi:uncharacterized protein (TIGR02271 family)
MMNQTSQTTERMLTAFFESREAADRAIEKLVSNGTPRSSTRLLAGTPSGPTGSSAPEGGGLWETLKAMFLPDEDRHTYAEGLRRGGYLVSVRVGEDEQARALDILDDEGTINIDERAQAWRSEGWSGAAADATGSSPSAATRGTSERDEVIPVAEEQLRIGKREVGHGRVRVRSYIVERPVQEQVSLRQERVELERRPVDRPVSGNEGVFRDRTIEAEEKAEEAVVDKRARVKEELAVKKDADQRTETISDTVRQTKVEVEDERQDRAADRR